MCHRTKRRGFAQGEATAFSFSLAFIPPVLDALSISQGKISKYENGLLNVSEQDLDAIAKILGYTPGLFCQEDKIYGLGSTFLFHRQRKMTPIAIQRKVQAQINLLRMQVERLFRGAEIETEVQFDPIDADSHNGNVEKVAHLVRAGWRLPVGPVANVTSAVESAGGLVLKCRFDTKQIDAAHLWPPGLPPMFFLNKDLPGDR
jgi:transcriptional regulator with XRE-family HTH domain